MYVVELSYTKPMSDVDVHLDAHRAFLDEHYAKGVFLLSGPKEPRTGGISLYCLPSYEGRCEPASAFISEVRRLSRADNTKKARPFAVFGSLASFMYSLSFCMLCANLSLIRLPHGLTGT